MCEDSAVRAHKVVLSACSPYFQKIFVDNPGKHPIVVLKDVRCWEMQCILDFMYKGETSVPEPQLTSLIKAAESLKVRGLTSSDQLPPGVSISASPTNLSNGYGRGRAGYSPSPSPHDRYSEPSHKISHMSGGPHTPHSNDSSPLSGGYQDQMSDRASGRASPVPGSGNCPRRKQARPRRRSGDSVNSSLDLSKAGSPPLGYAKRDSPNSVDDQGPENLSLRRSNSPGHAPAINLVKMEQLVEDRERRRDMEDNISDESMDRDRDCDSKPHQEMERPALSNGSLHHLQEQEALQALNFMASGGGLPHPLLPPPVHSPLHPLHSPNHFPGLSSLHKPHLPTSSSSPNYSGVPKPGLEYQRISIDRSKLSEDEAFEHAIDMISSRQMGFRKAADFFQVSKWKLYKTARKRGIYAEIKKHNQAHALSKVPTNVQHFAELGVYKQIRKKLPTGDKDIFPHLPRQSFQLDDEPKLLKTFTNLNNNDNNNLPLKHNYDKREVTFDKRYNEQVKSYDGKPLEIKTYEKQHPTLPLHSPFAGISGKPYHGLEEPIKLVKPIKRANSHNDEDDEDEDDDDHLLVIAHRENGNHEDESDHESSERSDRADDSA